MAERLTSYRDIQMAHAHTTSPSACRSHTDTAPDGHKRLHLARKHCNPVIDEVIGHELDNMAHLFEQGRFVIVVSADCGEVQSSGAERSEVERLAFGCSQAACDGLQWRIAK